MLQLYSEAMKSSSRMNVIVNGGAGTGKTTTSAIVAKESTMEKSVHMHTDDFYHYLSKGAPPTFAGI